MEKQIITEYFTRELGGLNAIKITEEAEVFTVRTVAPDGIWFSGAEFTVSIEDGAVVFLNETEWNPAEVTSDNLAEVLEWL